MKKVQQGFTLIELMIVVAIIGILAAVAIPSYQNYTKKARFTEVVQAVTPLKEAVDECVQTQGLNTAGAVSGCAPGSNGVPTGAVGSSGQVASVTVDAGGTGGIDAVPNATNGILSSWDYKIVPTVTTTGNAVWSTATTSGCLAAGMCK